MKAAVLSASSRRFTMRSRLDAIRRRRFFPAAFTLIELVVVLVLISIVGAIVVPRYGSAINRYRAEMSARRIAADLNYARSMAIATSTTVSVSFNSSNNSYQIAGVTDPDHGGTFGVTLSADPYCSSFASASAISGTFSISFNGYGIPSSTPTIVVSSNDSSRSVVVNPDVGSAVVN